MLLAGRIVSAVATCFPPRLSAWPRQGSNLRHPACRAGALPSELRDRKYEWFQPESNRCLPGFNRPLLPPELWNHVQRSVCVTSGEQSGGQAMTPRLRCCLVSSTGITPCRHPATFLGELLPGLNPWVHSSVEHRGIEPAHAEGISLGWSTRRRAPLEGVHRPWMPLGKLPESVLPYSSLEDGMAHRARWIGLASLLRHWTDLLDLGGHVTSLIER